MSEPKEFMRYGVMRDWLRDEYGIAESETRKLTELDVIKGRPLHRGGRDVYLKSQVMKDVIEARQSAEEQTLEVQRPIEVAQQNGASTKRSRKRPTSNAQHPMKESQKKKYARGN